MLLMSSMMKILWKRTSKTKPKRIQDRKGDLRKVNKIYVKWKGYNNSFNSWIDKNDVM